YIILYVLFVMIHTETSIKIKTSTIEKVSANWESNAVTPLRKNGFMRLPGICRRLKRRRVTIVVNISTLTQCSKTPPGQVCRCPQGSRCSHFFLHSI
uniref:Cocaine- and amphetamine-regulated transcript protein n=1 Tax=Poecilia reticulata TaxID=8081 RepID=A0A3P9PN05_POERE